MLYDDRETSRAEAARLRTALDAMVDHWESLSDSAESSLAHYRNKGGQHAGIPEMIGVPVSQLKALKRRARDATEYARAALSSPPPTKPPTEGSDE